MQSLTQKSWKSTEFGQYRIRLLSWGWPNGMLVPFFKKKKIISKFRIACQGLEGQTLPSQRVTQDMALVGGLCLIQALYPGCALIYWCTHAWTSALERRILKRSHFKAKCSLGHQGLCMLKNSKTNGYLYYLKAPRQ